MADFTELVEKIFDDECGQADLAALAQALDDDAAAQDLLVEFARFESQLRSVVKGEASGTAAAMAVAEEADASVAKHPAPAAGKGRKAKTIGNYEIIEKIGQGGMGAVFKARQISMDRIVALKILPPRLAEDPTYLERFFREARSAGQCSHANLISVYDFGQMEQYHCFSMEFIDGPSLKQLLKSRGPLDETTALNHMLKIASALQAAHAKGIVHRDVKPDNILVGSDGEPKLADLGLAKPMSGDADVTMGGKSIGTPHYMSPEQSQGRPTDGRADLYSLGATFFHLLTGEPLFTAPTSAAIMVMHVTDKPRRVREVRPEISAGLDAVIAKCLQKSPDKRYTDAGLLIDDLEALRRGETPRHCGRMPGASAHAEAVPVGPTAHRRPTGHGASRGESKPAGSKLWIAGGVMGATALIAIVAFVATRRDQTRPPPDTSHPLPVVREDDRSRDGQPPPVAPPQTGDAKQRAAEMLAYARGHFGENPTAFAKTLEYLGAALQAAEGTVVKFEVEKEIVAVKEKQLGWAREQWLPVAGKASAALTANDYDGALAASHATDPAWQSFITDAQAALQEKIQLAGEAAVQAKLDEAAAKFKADDFAACEMALASVAEIRWQPGVTVAQPKIAALTKAIAERKVELADAATAAWHEVRQELFDLLLAKRLDDCAGRVAALKADPANVSAREQLDGVAAITKAYQGYDDWVVATVKGKVGEQANLAAPREPERPATLGKVEPDPTTRELVLYWRVVLEVDGIKGSTTEKMPFAKIPPHILNAWIKGWEPKTDADRFMVLVDALGRGDQEKAAPLLAAMAEHPLAGPAKAKMRKLEVGAIEAAAIAAWEPLAPVDPLKLTEERANGLIAKLDAFKEAHGPTKHFAAITADWQAKRDAAFARTAEGRLKAGLVLHLTFDDADPTACADCSDRGGTFDLKAKSGHQSLLAPGLSGKGYRWADHAAGDAPGAGFGVQIGGVADRWAGMPALTFSSWIRLLYDEPPVDGPPPMRLQIVGLAPYQMGGPCGFSLDPRSGSAVLYEIFAEKNPNRVPGKKCVNDGRWHHLAAVFDGALPAGERWTFYLDGELQGRMAGGYERMPADGGLLFNVHTSDNRPSWMHDELRIYVRPLGPDDIKALYLSNRPDGTEADAATPKADEGQRPAPPPKAAGPVPTAADMVRRKWDWKGWDGKTSYACEFRSDGTLTVGKEPGTWRIEGGEMRCRYGEKKDVAFTWDGREWCQVDGKRRVIPLEDRRE